MLVSVRSSTPDVSFIEEIFLHSSYWFSEELLTLSMLVLVRNFSYTSDVRFSEMFFFHSSC